MMSGSSRVPPAPRRLAVRGVNWLGDAVMSTPALLALREAFPTLAITLVSPEKLAALWEHHPAVQEVVRFSPSESAFSLARRLRSQTWDAGLILPNSFRSALELWLARVPVRIGYGGQGRSWLLTRAIPARPEAVRMRKKSAPEVRQLVAQPTNAAPDGISIGPLDFSRSASASTAHHLHQYLHLVAQMGGSSKLRAPRLFVTEAEVTAFADRIGLSPTPPALVFGLNPGAEYGPAKRWPAERFIAAAREIRRRVACHWLIFGGIGDTSLASEIEAGLGNSSASGHEKERVVNLAGQTSLRELLAALKLCHVVLTNDTGPMHVAAALQVPVVALFGSTDPELTGPGLPGDPLTTVVRGQAVCAPCFLRECPIDFRCMREIGVEAVVEAVVRLVKRA